MRGCRSDEDEKADDEEKEGVLGCEENDEEGGEQDVASRRGAGGARSPLDVSE